MVANVSRILISAEIDFFFFPLFFSCLPFATPLNMVRIDYYHMALVAGCWLQALSDIHSIHLPNDALKQTDKLTVKSRRIHHTTK